jgi:cell division protein FtsW
VVKPRKHADRILFVLILLLVGTGLVVFFSASLGILARTSASVFSIVANHLLLGILGGSVAMLAVSRIHYRLWRPYAPWLYALALLITALVFIPSIGFEAGGARRWLVVGSLSLQPAEALKIGTIILFASLLSTFRAHLSIWQWGIGLFFAVFLGPAVLLLSQPDTGTLGVIAVAMGAMFLTAGARWRDIGILTVAAVLMLGVLVIARPYVLDRVMTFVNPFADPLGSGYQIKQSLIAIGSGGLTGRGFGQSVQKFSYLPEPMADSIFAVAAEEFGLIGSLWIIGLFVAFAVRGFWISVRAPDYYGAVLGVGIVAYIIGQAFMNIASMVGLIPLTGLPLVFMSHGGSAMLIALGSCGILLNISRYAKAR